MVADCPHLHMKFDLSAQTSLMNVSFYVFGVHCEDCDRKWDVGELLQAITKMAKLEAVEKEIRIIRNWNVGEHHGGLPPWEPLDKALSALETQDDNAD